jgi:hypothetical protein
MGFCSIKFVWKDIVEQYYFLAAYGTTLRGILTTFVPKHHISTLPIKFHTAALMPSHYNTDTSGLTIWLHSEYGHLSAYHSPPDSPAVSPKPRFRICCRMYAAMRQRNTRSDSQRRAVAPPWLVGRSINLPSKVDVRSSIESIGTRRTREQELQLQLKTSSSSSGLLFTV